ncbi:MAG: PEGA domain-containing protein [Candidatus Eisenbacteria bacterium]
MVGYRSEFLHLWVLAADDAPGLDPQPILEALKDLEHAALSLPGGVISPPASGLPLEVQHALAGLQFLRDQLWEPPSEFAGLLSLGGRVWAIHSGIEVTLEQMTGAPARWRWHEWEGGSPLAWSELGAGEVWRLDVANPAGVLHAHYRPSLAALPPATEADAFAAAARAQAESAPARDEGGSASRQARRRRRKREAAAPALRVVPPAPVPAPVHAPVPRVASVARVERSPRVAPAPRPAPLLRAAPKPWAKLRLPAAPRALLVGAGLGLLAAILGVAGFFARKPLTALVVGHYTLEMTTSPAGARVRVDGQPQPGRTPLALALAPGEHRVDVGYGEYASAGFTVDGVRGSVVRRDFAWSGSLGIASSDSTVRLAVMLDGVALGHTPLWRDAVPVGRHRLGFTAPGVRAWEEEVQVRAGQSARVSADPVKVPNYGLVTARAQLVSSDGVQDMDGVPVFVDGQHAGATPLDLKLSPGPHSVRIARAAGAPSIHLIDVQPGGRFFASAEFGRPADPMVAFDPPARVSRSAPPRLAIRLAADLPLPVRQASVFLRTDGGAFVRLPVAWTAGSGSGQGVFDFPVDRLGAAKSVTYYVELETREGEEYFSELHTIPVQP